MKKTASICCIAIGTVLLLSALFLVLHNVAEDRKSGETAERVLDELKQEIPEYQPATAMPAAENYDPIEKYETTTVPEQETIEIDGGQYMGYITIPALSVELPVLADWSYPNLKIAPCRYVGSLSEGNLVICAHNYNSHFGRINDLNSDDEIIFTETTGQIHRYSVVNTEQLPGTAVEDIKFGNADDWDLTLFTCTLSGQSRVTVRAVRTEEAVQ